jgi:hypothetical protein
MLTSITNDIAGKQAAGSYVTNTPAGIAAAGGIVTNTAINLGTNHLTVTTIKPVADSTTAIRINAANGTNNVVTVDTTNGRVGIGTTSPGAKLEIGAPTADVIGLLIRPYSDTQTSPQLRIVNTGGSEEFSCLNGNLVLNVAGLGEGGNISAYSKVNTNSLVDIYSAMLDRGAGNGGVGLGLGYTFSLENGAGNRVLVGRFKYAWGTPTAGEETSNFTIQNISAGTLVDAMTIQGGNVGIGTNTPAAKLHVVGSAIISSNLTVNGISYIKLPSTAQTNGLASGVLYNDAGAIKVMP